MIKSARSNHSNTSKRSHKTARGNLSNRGGAAVIVKKKVRTRDPGDQDASESTMKMSDSESINISDESAQRRENEEAA